MLTCKSMKNLSAADFLELSVSERIQLVFDIWDSIANVPDSVELTESQKQELDKRLKFYHQNPDTGSPWGEVKTRILANS